MMYVKDPTDVLDYQWDWSDVLPEDDAISSRTVTVVSGDVVVDSSSFAGRTVTAWISGGTVDTKSKVTCHVTSSAGREADYTFTFIIRNL